MTHGALSGLLLKDLISGTPNPWTEVYEPSRKTPSGMMNYVRENLSVAKNLAGDTLPGELKSADELAAGQGGILRDGLRKIAACRDMAGRAPCALGGSARIRDARWPVLDRTVLGLLMPWFAFCTGWDGLEWAGRTPPDAG